VSVDYSQLDDRVAVPSSLFQSNDDLRAAILSRKGKSQVKRIEPERPNRLSHIPSNQQEEIKLRAFEIYQQRGRGDGYELEDWLQAESEILENKPTLKAA
jgi:hypothetical protein